MGYLIRETNKNDKDLINNFNKELESKGINFKLNLSFLKERKENDFIFERKFILTENKIKVRAGYTLKSQWFKVNDDLLQIGYYYNPITAGLFNKKYNICGVLLLQDAQTKYKNLFCLGMGGYSEPLPKLLKSLNWNLQTVPFFFKIYNPHSFLKNISYLKNTKFRSFLAKFLTNSGIGWLIIKIFFQLISLLHFRIKKYPNLVVREIDDFREDFDSVWKKTKQNNSFIAVRNSEYLKTLYSNKRFIKLKFFDSDKIIGWSISLCTQLDNHKQFGNMKLGSIVDCLSLKGYETSIIKKTSQILKQKGADLIVSNQSHIFWKNAFKNNSFISGPSNFVFASSIALSEKLKSNVKSKNYMHLTRGDGDGPINL